MENGTYAGPSESCASRRSSTSHSRAGPSAGGSSSVGQSTIGDSTYEVSSGGHSRAGSSAAWSNGADLSTVDGNSAGPSVTGLTSSGPNAAFSTNAGPSAASRFDPIRGASRHGSKIPLSYERGEAGDDEQHEDRIRHVEGPRRKILSNTDCNFNLFSSKVNIRLFIRYLIGWDWGGI